MAGNPAVIELAEAFGTTPVKMRARLGYYEITTRNKTYAQLLKEMRKAGAPMPPGLAEETGAPRNRREAIPEGVLARDGLPRDASEMAEANLAMQLHGIRERLQRIEPYILNLFHYVRTGRDIANMVLDEN